MRTAKPIAIAAADLAAPFSAAIPASIAGSISKSRSAPAISPLAEEVAELFHELRSPVLRYLLAFGLTIEDCEEVAQDVFLALFRHLQKDGARTNLRGWVFRVAHNLALKRRQSSYKDISRGTDFAGQGHLVADSAPDPEAEASERQTQQKLHAVWRALPEQDRRCMALRAEGLRYREIANTLEISLGGVALSLSRSLDRMAQVARKNR